MEKWIITGLEHLVLPENKEMLNKTEEGGLPKDIGANLNELLIAKARTL